MKRVLAYFCHPDDAEILASGTLFHLKSLGWEVGVATMTPGDCGSDEYSRDDIMRIRLGEAEAAAAYLGAPYRCTGLFDVEVVFNAENLRKVVDTMRKFNPDVVITHSPVDYMVDHEEAAKLVRSAAFSIAMPLYATHTESPAPIASATPALYYSDPIEGVDHFGNRILPQFYVDISAVKDSKREMLSRHASQRNWLMRYHGVDEYLNRMLAWAESYGRECGVPYAEGLRQHLGHGYPHEPVLQSALAEYVRRRA